MALSMAFDFFARHKSPTPENPKQRLWVPDEIDWRDNFKITKNDRWKMATEDEREGFNEAKPTFSIDDLNEIITRTIPRDQMYVLMGVCLGWTQKSISKFRKDQIYYVNGEMHIKQNRSKTGVKGHWWVCPELARLIEANVAQTPDRPDKLALLSDEGQPLLHGRTDTIATRWAAVRKHLPKSVPRYPFSRFRKLGGQLILNKSKSIYFVQLLEAHSKTTVAENKYVRPDAKPGDDETLFEQLHIFQREIYEDIKHIFAPKKRGAKAEPITEAVAA
jgi:hypothetical protein